MISRRRFLCGVTATAAGVGFAAVPPMRLLDSLTATATEARSQRLLLGAYYGKAMRVRRADGAEADFNLDDAASLRDFLGPDGGSIAMLYEQVGNRHLAFGPGGRLP